MQTKSIDKNIRAKMEEWLKKITDEPLRRSVKENLLVTGGSICSMFLGEPVNDYDVYLMDMDVCKKLAKYYIRPFSNDIVIFDGRNREDLIEKYNKDFDYKNSEKTLPIDCNNSFAISLRNLKPEQIKLYFNGAQGSMKLGDKHVDEKVYKPLFFSPNAISLSDDIQIVLRFGGTAEQIHKTFDFIHATNYFTFKEGLVRNLQAVESILTKQLKYQGSYYPVTSIIRAKKFIKRGFNINAGELLKIMFQISQLDLSSPDVLEEQLIGIDVAYFEVLIKALRDKFESDKEFKITTQWFNTLVDRIFNETEDIEH